MARYKDFDWNMRAPNAAEGTYPVDTIQVNVLMDIRDELKELNRLLRCPNFIAIPRKLDAIRRKLPTLKPRKPR